MELIVQQNYTSGHGDAIMAMTDYLNVVYDLKRMGFNTKLILTLNGNLYFKSKTPLDYFDLNYTSIFDEIKVIKEPIMEYKYENFTCVFTHSSARPGAHYWDLFISNDSLDLFRKNYEVKQYSMNGLVNNDLPKIKPKLSDSILEEYKKIIKEKEIKTYNSIYFRTQDLQEELDFLESKKEKIKEIIENNSKTFICSNSYSFKNYVKSLNNKNVFYLTLPLENEIGGNHLNHQELEDSILHERNIYTLLDMLILGESSEIDFFTTWNRYSNFLVFAGLNKIKIRLIGKG